jgi:hypothetical protein
MIYIFYINTKNQNNHDKYIYKALFIKIIANLNSLPYIILNIYLYNIWMKIKFIFVIW